MNILNVAYPFAQVNSSTAGGAEQILLSIDNNLVKAGHSSFVIASSGSYVSGILITPRNQQFSIINDSLKRNLWIDYKNLISKIIQNVKIDLIHFHGFDFHEYMCNTSIPILVTLHLPLHLYNKSYLNKNYNFNYVSQHQYLNSPLTLTNTSVIENGVEVPQDFVTQAPENYSLSIGRICPEKGYHISLNTSKKANIPFILAGTVYPYEEHIAYFKNKLCPEIDNNRFRFIGSIGPVQKRKLLSKAKCLLVPSLIQETSSLVAMEALAAGTPVIAFKAGALSDIVKNGVTGYIVTNEDEMIEAIRNIDKIDRKVCHSIALQKYTEERMVHQYFQLYEKLIAEYHQQKE